MATASIVKYYNEFLEAKSDPRVQNWRFVNEPMFTLSVIVLYLVVVLAILPAYMRNRKPFKLTKIIRYYDILQILSCVAIIYNMTTAGWWQGRYNWGCQPIDYSDDPHAVQLLESFYWAHLLKGVELIETVFFVLRKKHNQVTGLHLYHHASTYFLSWIGVKFIGGGMASVPIIVNSFIHVLMYMYYYLVSFGPKWQKRLAPWKPRLTMLQMVQFTFLILHALTALPSDCKVPRAFLLLYLPNIVVIYKMFYDFYQNSYNKKKSAQTWKSS